MDGQAEAVGAGGDGRSDVLRGAEPQLGMVGDAGGEDLGVAPPAPETGSQGGGPVDQGAGVEDLEDFRVRPAQR